MTDLRIQRNAVRGILLTPDGEVLLLRILPPNSLPYWVTPGGGLEAGESLEAGLRRELREEVGLESFEPGPLLWRRQFNFELRGQRFCQTEQYFAVHVPRFVPAMSDEVEARILHSFRWWSVPELLQLTERLAPRSLAAIVERYLRTGPPLEAPEIEIC